MSGLQGDAQDPVLTIGHPDMARPLGWGADRDQGKPTRKQRMHRVRDFDLGQFLFEWVVEGGMKVMARLTPSSTTG